MKNKTIVSRILVALLALLLILSLILPAFAAEEDPAPVSGSNTTCAAIDSVTAFHPYTDFLNPLPLNADSACLL